MSPDKSGNKAKVSPNGGQHTVIVTHNAETFNQGSPPVGCGYAFVEVVDQGLVDVLVVTRVLQAPDTPIKISREPVAQIKEAGNPAQSHEGLMANQHTVGERFISQSCRGCQMPVAHITAVTVDQLSLTVDNTREIILHSNIGNELESAVAMKAVAGIKKNNIFTTGSPKPLVHCIINALVRFADNSTARIGTAVDQIERLISGPAIDDYVLIQLASLPVDTVEGGDYGMLSVIADRND